MFREVTVRRRSIVAAIVTENVFTPTAADTGESVTDDESVTSDERNSSAAFCDMPGRLCSARSRLPPSKENEDPLPPSEGMSFASARTAAPIAQGSPTRDAHAPRRRSTTAALRDADKHRKRLSEGNNYCHVSCGRRNQTRSASQNKGNKICSRAIQELHRGRQSRQPSADKSNIASDGAVAACAARGSKTSRTTSRKLSTPMHRSTTSPRVPGILQRNGSTLELPRADAGWVAAGVAFSKNTEVYFFKR